MEEQNNNQVPGSQPIVPIAESEFEAPTQGDTSPVNVQPSDSPGAQPLQQSYQPVQPTQPAAPYQPFAPAVLPTDLNNDSTPVTAPAQKPKKKWLVPVIILAALLLIGGGASAYYFGVYQQPENVMLDALSKLTAAKAVQTDSTITINKDLGSDIKLKDVTLKANTAGRQSGQMDATANIEYKGKAVSVGSKVIATLADSAIYFQFNNVKQALQSLFDAAGETSKMPSGYLDGLDNIQGQWVKVTVDDIKKTDDTYGAQLECGVNALKKHSGDSNKELIELYKKNPFITVREKANDNKSNLQGYKISFDEAKVKAFGKSLEETQAYKDIKACVPSDLVNGDTSATVDSAVTDSTVYTLWIDRWTHELSGISFTGETGSGNDKVAYDGSVAVAYDPSVAVAAPSGAINFEEFTKRLELALQPMLGDVQSRARTNAAVTYAKMVVTRAEVYNANAGSYPKTLADFEKYPESSLADYSDLSIKATSNFPTDTTTVGYKLCSATGGQVVYFDETEPGAVAIGFGGSQSGTVKAFCGGASV